MGSGPAPVDGWRAEMSRAGSPTRRPLADHGAPGLGGSIGDGPAGRVAPVGVSGDRLTQLSAGGSRRRPTWVLVGALLVGVASLLGAWILTSVNHRISVLVAARDLDPGTPLAAGDIRVIEIGRTDQLRAIQPSQQDLVLGRATRGPVPEGTVLNTDLFTGRGEVVPAGRVVVASALDPGAAPLGLRPGDPVRLFVAVRTSGGQSGAADAALLGEGTVWSVDRDGQSATAKLLVSLLLPVELQARAVQAAYEGTLRVSLAGSPG